MGKSPIEWTEETWNPVRGCRRISPGCGGPRNEGGCYAERLAIRQAGPGGAYEGLVESTPNGPRWTGAAVVDEEKLLEPLHWKKPRTVFVDSMSDFFFEGFTDAQVARAVATMAATQHITYQVLTKRAERAADLLGSPDFREKVVGLGRGFFRSLQGTVRLDLPSARERIRWPLPNVWWGVSCEDRKHGLPRLEHLRRTPAVVRFVSFEPLLEDLGQVDLRGINWAIIGGESGPKSRPCHLAWIRSLVAQARAFGAAPFLKQLGARALLPYGELDRWQAYTGNRDDVITDYAGPEKTAGALLPLKHRKGGEPAEWPEDLRVREFPEVARG